MPRRHLCAMLAYLAASAGSVWGAAPAAREIPLDSRVLVLHSYHAGFTWSDRITYGIMHVFDEHRSRVDLCVEYMDTRRAHSSEYFDALAATFALKYRGRPVDVVICSDDYAFKFFLERGVELFGDVPMLFCSVTGYEPEMRADRALSGLKEKLEVLPTLSIARQLQPDATGVTVILDSSSTGLGLKKRTMAQLEEADFPLPVRYLQAETMENLLFDAASIDPGEIVLLFIFPPFRDGRVLSHEVNLKYHLAPVCRAPIYAVWDFYLDHGIIGGKLTNGVGEGRMVAELALNVLAGTDVNEIPVGTSPTRLAFDYDELVSHGISPRMLPANAEVINEPFSFYQEYWGLILSVVIVIGVLGTLVVVLAIAIVRRRQAEEELRESASRLELAMSAADVGLWEIQLPSGRFSCNDRWAQMLGYDRTDACTTRDQFESLVHPDDVEAFRVRLAEHLSGATRSFESEHRMLTRSGEPVWVEVRGMVVRRTPRGEPVLATGTQVDVTERRSEEDRQRQLDAQMQHMQKLESLGVLAGGIAHDFNNLLTGILGNVSLAQIDLAETSPVREYINDVETAASRAADLCRQMLAYSGKGKFVIEPVNLSELVREMSHLLEVSVSKKVRLHLDLDEHIPPVLADVTQLRQVVMNLITNASEAIGDRTGTVSVHTGVGEFDQDYLRSSYIDEELAAGSYAFFEVSDTGAGMSPDTLRRVFDPFFTTKFTGRGLGLSAVIGIVRGHKGAIKVYSESGTGTTFKVLFPVGQRSIDRKDTTRREPVAGSESLGGGTILVVDDDQVVRKTAAGLLERMGFDVLSAADGREGLDMFAANAGRIRCVLLDLTMPAMDGEECFREIRRINPEVRVVLSSGYNKQDATQRFSGKGLAGFVQKPFAYRPLAEALRQVLSRTPPLG